MTGALYKDIVTDYLPNATQPAYLNTTTVTKVLNWANASGARQQLWYDDPETLAKKYSAIKAAGIKGVGARAGRNTETCCSLLTRLVDFF